MKTVAHDRDARAELLLQSLHLTPIALRPGHALVLRESNAPAVVSIEAARALAPEIAGALAASPPTGSVYGILVIDRAVAVTTIVIRPCAAPGSA